MSTGGLHLLYSFPSHLLVSDQRAPHFDQPAMHSRRLQLSAIATMLDNLQTPKNVNFLQVEHFPTAY
jgi:hypothetical protein